MLQMWHVRAQLPILPQQGQRKKEERKETQDSGHNGEEKEISSGSQEDKDSGKEMEGKEE